MVCQCCNYCYADFGSIKEDDNIEGTLQVKKKRMRTIRESLELLKKVDPDTAVTYHFLRQLCETNSITVVKAGKKFLLNYDELLLLLNIEEN